ncbi:M48 family metallopeptidase [Olsenella sp. HMSC062G07]|uniref:M48 family metallopeptidase n=1 Tax=Olsenella sp. HMSC062G07 TaxID=1739330 RepID=UPI0008A5A75F|nr:SprT family zinc-dependent metalloprotease [Olsenella sp. HMSC062G07]OFK24327.1 hypothetical protein HMPREF2826_07800 [Olsenella sp. HMSC062G07]
MSLRAHDARPLTTITVDGLAVELHRGGVRRVNLRVRPDGSVRMSAPPHVSDGQLERLVRERRPWIEQRQDLLRRRSRREEARWRDGGALTLAGRPLRLRARQVAGARRSARICRDELVVVTPHDLTPEELKDACQPLARRLLRDEATRLMADLAPRMGVTPHALRIRRMRSRWGSCNVRTGDITLATELCFMPVASLACVCAHELCHLLEPSHGPRFWALMDRFEPDWQAEQAHLDANPPLR